MKKVCLVLSFLLLNSFLCSAAEEPNPVLDANGEELQEGQQYYMLPLTFWDFGGGLTLGRSVNATELCPRTVVQDRSQTSNGRPLTFTPVNSQNGVIRESTDLNIKFNAIPICRQSNVWKLEYAEEMGKYIVVTNGVAGNPGPGTLTSWFKFEANNRPAPINIPSYKLVYCPSVCDFCKPICGDLAIYFDPHGTRRLALGDETLYFLFLKA